MLRSEVTLPPSVNKTIDSRLDRGKHLESNCTCWQSQTAADCEKETISCRSSSTVCTHIKGEVRRKMNFTCVRVCGVEGRGKSLSGQFFFVCEKDDRGESSTKSLGGMTRPKDEMGSQIVFSEFDICHPILVYLSRNNHTQAQGRRFPAMRAPEPEFPVTFGSKWDPLTSAWRQGGTSPERLAELPTGVSPLQKRIWKWDFYHCSSCNFFFHICFCHLWCELLLLTT